MNDSLYEMEKRVYREIRRSSGATDRRDSGHDVTNTLRAVVLLGAICLGVLGMCQLKSIAIGNAQTAPAAVAENTGR